MKSSLLWQGMILLAFLLISCPQATVENPYQDLKTGVFWAQDLAKKEYYRVDAVLLAEGETCAVWADRNAGVSVAAGRAVAGEYDERIYNGIVGVFGSDEIMKEYDVDRDGKFTLFLLDIKDGFNGSGAYTAGYFFSVDLFSSGSFPQSNERDMIYVDTYPSRLCSEESYATIAHELQHFINYASRASRGRRLMETWIDEGLSAAAERIYLGRHNEERIARFNSSETIRRGNNFFVWGEKRDGYPDSILDEYATVYLFFQWLRLQSGGTAIFRRIVDSEHHDYRAVINAISDTFAENLDSTSWETVLRSWLAANYLNSPGGLYGYHGEIPNLRVRVLGGPTQSLLPGEGVYSAVGGGPAALPGSGGSNIRYAGLSSGAASSPQPQVSLDTLYPNGRLLTFNGNEQNDPHAWETGRLTNGETARISPSETNRSAAGGSWIIDARDILGRPPETPAVLRAAPQGL
jgi:hypothetical protein